MDKHQLLIPAASANIRQSMSPAEIGGTRYRFVNVLGKYSDAQLARAFLAPSQGVPFPLKAGDILRVVPKAQVNEHMYFPFEIAFREPQIVAGKPLIELLHKMKEFVRGVIMEFNSAGWLDPIP